MNHKFLLYGTGVGSNYGCDAIVLGTSRILKKRFPGSEVWFPHNSYRSPNYTNILDEESDVVVKSGWRDIRIPALCRSFFRKTGIPIPTSLTVPIGLVKQADCVLSIGGDLYTFANKEEDWPYPYLIVEAGDRIMKAGKPYVIWCASVGPLEQAGPHLGKLVEHLKRCSAIIVRELTSYLYLKDTLKLRDNVFLAADPAFMMAPKPFRCSFLEAKSKEPILAINFSLAPIEHIRGQESVDNLVQELSEYVKCLLDNLSVKIFFVPHVKKDYELLASIYKIICKQYTERIWILPENIGSEKTKWAVSQANALLTMRFHCALAGFSTNTPTMILISTSKGTKITKEIYGDLEYSLNIKEMNSQQLVYRVKNLLNNEKSIRERIKPAFEKMKVRALSAADVLAGVL